MTRHHYDPGFGLTGVVVLYTSNANISLSTCMAGETESKALG